MKKIIYVSDKEAQVTKAFAKNASVYGTEEFKLWREYKTIYSEAQMVVKTIKKNPNKKTRRNMTYANMEEFIKTHEIHVATLTVPKKNARTIASQLEEWGIRAIWNFAPTDLHVSDDVCVKNVHLDESLMTLSYNFRNRGKEKYSYHSYMDD